MAYDDSFWNADWREVIADADDMVFLFIVMVWLDWRKLVLVYFLML